MASMDIRDYVSPADLRNDLREVVEAYCAGNAHTASQAAFEEFFLCETVEEKVPLSREAWTLKECRDRNGSPKTAMSTCMSIS